MILPMDRDLSLEELELLATMINLPEADYCNTAKIAKLSQDSKSKIDRLMTNLVIKGYVLASNGRYMVNKVKLPSMRIVKEV